MWGGISVERDAYVGISCMIRLSALRLVYFFWRCASSSTYVGGTCQKKSPADPNLYAMHLHGPRAGTRQNKNTKKVDRDADRCGALKVQGRVIPTSD